MRQNDSGVLQISKRVLSVARHARMRVCVCVCARSDSTDLPRLEASLAMTRPSSELFD